MQTFITKQTLNLPVLKLLMFTEKCLNVGAPLHKMVWKSVLYVCLSSLGISAATRHQTAVCHVQSLQVSPDAVSRAAQPLLLPEDQPTSLYKEE